VRVGITVKAITAGGMPDDAVPIEPDQLVAAVEDPFTLSAIAHLLIAAVKVTTNAYAGSMDFDRLILMNEWADRTAHLLVWRRQQLLAEGGT
jgi:hypothetical protein